MESINCEIADFHCCNECRKAERQNESNHMKLKHLTAVALALGLPTLCALAQDNGQPPANGAGPGGPGGQRRGPRRLPPAVIVALDTNHDGILSADEIANAPVALKTLDKNGDGQLTMDELMAPPPPRGGPGPDGQGGPGGPGGRPDGPPPGGRGSGPDGQGGGRPPLPPIIQALDTNHDGVISADEIANAAASLLKLDKNGDGQLTMDEMMGPPPPRRGPGPDGQGPDGPPPGGGQNQ
jgi:EF hand